MHSQPFPDDSGGYLSRPPDHRWRFADTESSLDRNCCWDEDARIGLCGDWLNGGKVEGAWLSGRGLARRIGAAASVMASRP